MSSNAAALHPRTSPSPLAPLAWKRLSGRVLSALASVAMLASASLKLARWPQIADTFHGTFGYPPGALAPIGLVELACAVLYLLPQTAVLGAVLLTGYLGGAVATHVRIGQPFAVPLIVGTLVWAGLYLRDGRLRALAPLRRA